ncbi:hypothetical protein FIBSPDRAFT_945366 [Athelia psychrophila]|uniref:DUF803-domain-containing protein n=1 Tax=Athelia psychrophila TaxID=1759441 RepID=A0A166U629_9AGAM|nr:hypothetical protein FIBSPDRAFT_945366 [Fibularhizoctonia sp. CBS 109695]
MVSIPLGILIGLLASFVQSLGLTVQRKSHVLNGQLPESQQKVEHRRPLWLIGFAIFISSNIIGSLVQIASLPVVILAPLGAVSLLWNAFFARFILGDVFSPWMILGTLFIAGGAVLIAIFGIVPEPTRSLEDLLELFRRPAFVAYFSLLGATVVVCLIITHIVEFSLARKLATHISQQDAPPSGPQANTAVLTTGVTEEIVANTEHTPLLVLDRKNKTASMNSSATSLQLREPPAIKRTRLLIAISYASFSGIISGMCLLFAKSGVELLLLTIKGHNQFWRWQSWMLLIALVAFALLQLWYLHKALILADPTLVCPSAFCFYNLSSIVNGLVYFDQFALISPLHLCLVILGIFVLLAGVWVVSIQAGGGGGVDDDQWDEEGNEASEEGEACSILSAVSEDNAAQDIEARGRPESLDARPTYGAVGINRKAVSESQADNMPSFQLRRPSEDEATPLSISTTSPPPLGRQTLPPADFSPTSLSTRARRRYRRPSITVVDATSPPLGGASVLGGGLSIGLGPMSPGFSIAPRNRRSRVSGHGFADLVDDAVEVRRRTVSEGNARGLVGSGSESQVPTQQAAAIPAAVTGGKENARRRWNWVRGLVRR